MFSINGHFHTNRLSAVWEWRNLPALLQQLWQQPDILSSAREESSRISSLGQFVKNITPTYHRSPNWYVPNTFTRMILWRQKLQFRDEASGSDVNPTCINWFLENSFTFQQTESQQAHHPHCGVSRVNMYSQQIKLESKCCAGKLEIVKYRTL